MTRFLGNWEVESDILLPADTPFVRHDHPDGLYSVFLRNIPEQRADLTYLSMQLIFDAPEIQQAKSIGETHAKQFLEYLSFASSLKVRLRGILHIFNWEEDGKTVRDALYFSRAHPNSDAPFEELDKPLLDTIAVLQTQSLSPRLRLALKWFSVALAVRSPDDQFAYFWFVVELVAQLIKEPVPTPDKCPTCRAPLFCPDCQSTPLHRPYPKQAIEQLFHTFVPPPDTERFYAIASDVRNMLLHGEETEIIEAKHSIELPALVDDVGRLAWHVICSQFLPSLNGKRVSFVQISSFVNHHITGSAHVKIGFTPNFENPNPSQFPEMKLTIDRQPRPPVTNPQVIEQCPETINNQTDLSSNK